METRVILLLRSSIVMDQPELLFPTIRRSSKNKRKSIKYKDQ